MAEIQKHLDTYKNLNTIIAALSTDSPEQSQNLVEKMELKFSLICDEKREVIDLYDLRNPFEHGGVARPATFIIKPGGLIYFRSLDGTSQRLDLTQELEFLVRLNKTPDALMQGEPRKKWVLTSPGDLWRVVGNIFAKGSLADWKHAFLFPVGYLKIFWHRLFK